MEFLGWFILKRTQWPPTFSATGWMVTSAPASWKILHQYDEKQQLMTPRTLTGFINHNHRPEAVCFLQESSERLPCLLPLPQYSQGIKLN